MGKNGSDHPLGRELVKVSIQPCFLLRLEAHRLRDNRAFVLQVQAIVILGVLDEAYVCLLGG